MQGHAWARLKIGVKWTGEDEWWRWQEKDEVTHSGEIMREEEKKEDCETYETYKIVSLPEHTDEV